VKAQARRHSVRLASFLITVSVRFLPFAWRERFREEWMAELDEMERQDIPLLRPAFRILLGAPSVARALQTQTQREASQEPLQESLLERLATPTPNPPASAPYRGVRYLVLGVQLRLLREASGIPAELAAEAIRCTQVKISGLEHGRLNLRERDVADLLTLYGVTDAAERAALLDLPKDAGIPGWWHAYSDTLPSWFQPYTSLAASASVIRTYQVQYVPELLQTADYSRALIEHGCRPGGDKIPMRTELQVRRQEVLRAPNPPLLWAVVDEAALRRPVGGKKVFREQLKYLIELADQPMVTLQILPFSAGAHLAMVEQSTILRFAQTDIPDVVCIEQLTGALYLEEQDAVDSYIQSMDLICQHALPVNCTERVINNILADI
jgi:transcriptional regulator with XRE-family HTH domain